MLASLMELGDDAGQGVADTGNLGEAAFRDQPVQRQRAKRKVLGGTAIGPGAIGVAARQLHPLGDLPKECRTAAVSSLAMVG